MLDYLKTMPAGTRMAVFGLSNHLFVIQGFTSDPELLKAAITRSEKLMPLYSPLEDIKQDPAQFDDKTLEEQGNNMAERGLITFAAIRQIAHYLSGMPGRKNLIWASASFPLQFPPEPRDPDAWPHDFPPMFDYTQDIKSMGDMLARAHIAVYPIEPRGLDRILHPGDRKAAIEFGEHGTMDDVADLTGGHNFHNTNGIGEALAAAIDTGANFYTLTYTPTNQTLDTRFRTITVKVSQPNLHLTYRNGYYAVDPATDSRGKTVEKVTPMQAAMMRGSLEPTQILFRVRVAPSPATDAKLSADNQPDPKQMKPPYRHYAISYAIDVHGIDLAPGPDGNYRGGFEYGVRVYNADGDEIVNSVSKTVNPILPPAVYKSMLSGGANAHLDIDLPTTGNYFLRIAVHDLATDHVGAIEIPTSSITPNPTPTTTPGK
jgi:VWFA-related protein